MAVFKWDCNVHFRVGLVPKGLIHGLYPIQSNHAHSRPPRCAAALAWILQELRMAGYMGRMLEQYGLPVYSHVIYLRPNAGRHDRGEYVQDRPGYRVVIQYKVIRLSKLAGQAILDGGYTGLLPFAPLMQPPEGLAAAPWLRQCVQRAEALPMAAETKANFLTDLVILSGLVYDYQTIQRIIPEDIMYESSVIQHFAEQGREQVGREFLLDVLALRFQPEDVQRLASRIEAIEDVQRLKQLHRAAIQVPASKPLGTC